MSLPGVSVRTRAHRYYPFNELGAHLLGFMNEINSKELEKYKAYGYHPGDYVGRMGIERSAEAILRGIDMLQAGDALLIAGKGHETGQIVGDDILPFDDAEQASVAVSALDGGRP